MTFYSRKSPRIPQYDYSTNNYYFLTICTHNRKCIFGYPGQLNELGQIVQRHIEQLSSHYKGVKMDKYVVMPNHVHMILYISIDKEADVTQIIGQFKSGVSREIRKKFPDIVLWQRSFHDHVIRSQEDYEGIWLYIDANPQCWQKDCFYIDQTLITGN